MAEPLRYPATGEPIVADLDRLEEQLHMRIRAYRRAGGADSHADLYRDRDALIALDLIAEVRRLRALVDADA